MKQLAEEFISDDQDKQVPGTEIRMRLVHDSVMAVHLPECAGSADLIFLLTLQSRGEL
jgi:hypothetical protein